MLWLLAVLVPGCDSAWQMESDSGSEYGSVYRWDSGFALEPERSDAPDGGILSTVADAVGDREGPPADCDVHLCELLPDVAFWSIGTHECGAVGGMCRWSIAFDDPLFTWVYSDLGVVGTWECGGDQITGHSQTEGDLAGTYDPCSGTLVWADVAYVGAR